MILLGAMNVSSLNIVYEPLFSSKKLCTMIYKFKTSCIAEGMEGRRRREEERGRTRGAEGREGGEGEERRRRGEGREMRNRRESSC